MLVATREMLEISLVATREESLIFTKSTFTSIRKSHNPSQIPNRRHRTNPTPPDIIYRDCRINTTSPDQTDRLLPPHKPSLVGSITTGRTVRSRSDSPFCVNNYRVIGKNESQFELDGNVKSKSIHLFNVHVRLLWRTCTRSTASRRQVGRASASVETLSQVSR